MATPLPAGRRARRFGARSAVLTFTLLGLVVAAAVDFLSAPRTPAKASAYSTCFKECGRDRSECLGSNCGKPVKPHCRDQCYDAFENCVKGCESLRGARTPRD